MSRTISLSGKLIGGFGAVLLFMLLLGGVSYYGFHQVDETSQTLAVANEMLLSARKCKEVSEHYVISKNATAKTEMDSEIEKIGKISSKLSNRLSSSEQKKLVTELSNASREYSGNFDKYIAISNEQKKQSAIMVDSARKAISQTSNLREHLQKESQDKLKKINDSVSMRIWKVQQTREVMQAIQTCRVIEKRYWLSKDISLKNEFDSLCKQIATKLTAVRKTHSKQVDWDSVDDIKNSVLDYQKILASKAQSGKAISASDHQAIDSAFAQTLTPCKTYIKNQSRKLTRDRKKANALIENMLAMDRKTSQVCEKILLARRHEKDFMLRQKDKYVGKLDSRISEIEKLIKDMSGTFASAADIATYEEIKLQCKNYQSNFHKWVKGYKQQQQILASMNEVIDNFITGCAKIERAQNNAMNSTMALANSCIIIGGIFALIAGVAAAVMIGISITKPVHKIIAELNAGADQTTSACGQVSGASQSLAQGASEQAATIEEASASIEEMSSMTKQNAANATEANSIASIALESAQTGSAAMTRMSEAIADIKNSSDETAKIIKTIDDIAFQTNLLALNAAVEAARAGEAGKGFAVVAEEVRNLAQRSAEAAKNTAQLIEDSVNNAERGVNISQEVADALTEIASNNGKVNSLINEIAAASKEQAQGIDQINTAVSQMDQVTQSNAANAEETAAAAEEMDAQAEELKRQIGQLRLIVNGSKGTADQIQSAQNISAVLAEKPARKAMPAMNTASNFRQQSPAAKPAVQASKASAQIPFDDDANLADF